MILASARILRAARAQAGLTQREVARRAGVPPSTVARIESGRIVPRVDTLDRLLAATGQALTAGPRLGDGIDRSQIRACLALSPAARLRHAALAGRRLQALRRAHRVG